VKELKDLLKAGIIVAVAVGFMACNSGVDYEQMRQEELALLERYIDEVHPGAEPTSSGLYYFNEEGTGVGDTIQAGDKVQIYYATWALYESSGEFDSLLVDETDGYLDGHRYDPYSFTAGAGSNITGLDEAIFYMQPGTRSHLVINSGLAYGQNGSGSVGMFQTLLMEVEVYKVIPYDTGDSSTE